MFPDSVRALSRVQSGQPYATSRAPREQPSRNKETTLFEVNAARHVRAFRLSLFMPLPLWRMLARFMAFVVLAVSLSARHVVPASAPRLPARRLGACCGRDWQPPPASVAALRKL